MKHKFVLDVNTLIFAQNYCDAKGNTDYAPATLFLLIAQNCHKIVCDRTLRDAYFEHLSDDRFGKLLKHLLFNSEKCNFHDYLPNYPFEKNLPPDDVEMVKLAVFANAVLVTSDNRLKAKIQKLNISQSHNLKVKDPANAQNLAETKDP